MLAKEEKVRGLLAQPLSRLDMEALLPLVGLMSLVGETRLWDCLLPGWKVECRATVLYSDPPYPEELPLVWLLSSRYIATPSLCTLSKETSKPSLMLGRPRPMPDSL